ncbi:MAG TPA: helix-turn-helix transcriptional regulator [Paraburkholderia sp.]|uniref:helix-turn-helix domain-containing protein n=1 Tax=Paraburkholderia sp. TaxID=1926495 RepID=UPI002C8B5443|nr:helix-turn-helix transcriptional regulator [Paraburkholderia sp.]HTR09118.1 helix-turn-helix transcriptional regulator [Paraburkholderia sp.]
MSETTQLIETLKRELRARKLTYRDVAQALRLSEPAVKRLFSKGRFTIERLEQMCGWLDLTLSELVQLSASTVPALQMLDASQETRLVSDERLLLVAVCALNHWTADDIVRTYRLTRAQCLKLLLTLEHMGLISLMPGDRIRLRIARDFDWIPGGPIRQYFMTHGLGDFLEAGFTGDGESLAFVQGMLTEAARAELALELRRLKSRFASLHDDCTSAPLTHRQGTGLLIGLREWEPHIFARLRRQSDA